MSALVRVVHPPRRAPDPRPRLPTSPSTARDARRERRCEDGGAPGGGWFGDARPRPRRLRRRRLHVRPVRPRRARHAAPGAAALGHLQPRAQVHLRVPHRPHPRGTLRRSYAHLPRPLLLRVGRRGARRVSWTTRRRASRGRVREKPRAVDSRGDGTGRAQRRRHRLPGVRSRAHLIHPRGISPLHHQRLSTPRRGGVRATRRGRDVGRRRARALRRRRHRGGGRGKPNPTPTHGNDRGGRVLPRGRGAVRRVHRPSRRVRVAAGCR